MTRSGKNLVQRYALKLARDRSKLVQRNQYHDENISPTKSSVVRENLIQQNLLIASSKYSNNENMPSGNGKTTQKIVLAFHEKSVYTVFKRLSFQELTVSVPKAA